MRNFVIFFQGKEGSSALVRQLDRFEQISVICQVGRKGLAWEPFDKNACGAMTLSDRRRCLELIFNHEPLDMEALNHIYLKTATNRLGRFDKSNAVGFKMRFKPPWYTRWWYRRSLLSLFARYRVLVLLLVRQDLLRWALSIYHGDGEGRPGALQFRLADGRISREDINTIEVDCERLDQEIAKCRLRHAYKKGLVAHLGARGSTCRSFVTRTSSPIGSLTCDDCAHCWSSTSRTPRSRPLSMQARSSRRCTLRISQLL